MMSTTAKNPEITPIPVQLSEPEFTAFTDPNSKILSWEGLMLHSYA
jgi:hypothetical protein